MSYHGRFALTVYCGSHSGLAPAYARKAAELGRAIGELGCALVYGGSHLGMMGQLADNALAAGAPVLGVIPSSLEKREAAHKGLTELKVVHTLHERKAVMSEHADAFVALPGGFGTLDEIFEAITWRQLGMHQKPLAFLNVNGYFDGLVDFIRTGVAQEFISSEHAQSLQFFLRPDTLVSTLKEGGKGPSPLAPMNP